MFIIQPIVCKCSLVKLFYLFLGNYNRQKASERGIDNMSCWDLQNFNNNTLEQVWWEWKSSEVKAWKTLWGITSLCEIIRFVDILLMCFCLYKTSAD